MIRGLLLAALLCLAGLARAQDASDAPVLRVELESETVAVGQPATLRITVLVPTWMLDPPVFPSLEAPNLIVRLPGRSSGPVSERIDGETWSGISRAYRLFPMIAGAVDLPPGAVGITYADPDDQHPVKQALALPPVRIEAIVPPGAEALDPLIVAEALELEQRFDGPETVLAEGDAVVRTVTARITGSPPLFLPPLLAPVPAQAVQTYPDNGIVRESEDRGKISGSRIDSATYVARFGGALDLPDISLRWFNSTSGQVETATVAGRSFTVEAPAAPREPMLTARQVAVLALAALMLALIAWIIRRFFWDRLRSWGARIHQARIASERFAARKVRAAIAARDETALRNGLALWTARLPGCGGAEEDALQDSLLSLGAARFSAAARGDADWAGLRHSFDAARGARKARRHLTRRTGGLPPLNPF